MEIHGTLDHVRSLPQSFSSPSRTFSVWIAPFQTAKAKRRTVQSPEVAGLSELQGTCIQGGRPMVSFNKGQFEYP